MKKGIIFILVVFALWVPGIISAEDATYGQLISPTPVNTRSQETSVLYPKEWYIVEKIPTGKGLGIGVFVFQEGMPIDHIQSVFGKPQEIIALEMEEDEDVLRATMNRHKDTYGQLPDGRWMVKTKPHYVK